MSPLRHDLEIAREWARTRYRLSQQLARAAVVVALAWAASPEPDLTRVALGALGAWSALGAMRLRDDLYSAPQDALTHPERVLARAGQPTLLYAVVGAAWIGVGLIMGALHARWGVWAWWATVVSAELIYAARLLWPCLRGPLGELLGLSRYGALVMTLAAGAVSVARPEAWCAAMIMTSCAACYDLLGDARLALGCALLAPPLMVGAWAAWRGASGLGQSLPLALWLTCALWAWRRAPQTQAAVQARGESLGVMIHGAGLALALALVMMWL